MIGIVYRVPLRRATMATPATYRALSDYEQAQKLAKMLPRRSHSRTILAQKIGGRRQRQRGGARMLLGFVQACLTVLVWLAVQVFERLFSEGVSPIVRELLAMFLVAVVGWAAWVLHRTTKPSC